MYQGHTRDDKGFSTNLVTTRWTNTLGYNTQPLLVLKMYLLLPQSICNSMLSADRKLYCWVTLHYKQTRDLLSMLVQCLSPCMIAITGNVCDVGPTLNHHWVNVLCLLGSETASNKQIGPTITHNHAK